MKNYKDVDVLAYIYYTNENKKNFMTFEVFKVISREFSRFDIFYIVRQRKPLNL